MTVEEAVVFLEWIKVIIHAYVQYDIQMPLTFFLTAFFMQVGIKFKEETLDTAKKAGLTNSKEN